jgi:hypothetical protein
LFTREASERERVRLYVRKPPRRIIILISGCLCIAGHANRSRLF